ncbi:MAG: hypothetical protein A3J10_03265 [Candidatus Sungbacteria bacterium RIFCSPLOWO2_02_FULL_54_10]|nr:MAG: hypothetical protein A3J10_03265 [Candidatus Sungbacteria bacterium RIFCSPLOWO2_02_FULL_54_10]
METPTIAKQTKQYLIVKIPLPVQEREIIVVPEKSKKIGRAEQRLWGIIQDGEQEYRERKTIRARSIDEALKIHARKKN